MTTETVQRTKQEALIQALNDGNPDEARRLLNTLPPAEAAHLLASSPPRERHRLWRLLTRENEPRVLQYLGEDIRRDLLKHLKPEQLAPLVAELDTDDLADLLQELPEQITGGVLDNLDQQHRDRLKAVLDYPENTAGGLMDLNMISVRPELSLAAVQRYLRRRGNIPEMTDHLAVVNRRGHFIGLLPLTRVLLGDPDTVVRETMLTDVEPIPATTTAHRVARLFERRDLVSAPVVDDNGVLLGRITVDDVIDVIMEEADHSFMGMAGLDEDEDTFGSVWYTLRHRAIWLGINLLTALLASAVIGLFQQTINKVVALAVLMPIVASMGGIAGSQTLTLVIRALALGQIQSGNTRYLLIRELAVGALNGVLWALVVGVTAGLWFANAELGAILGAAMIINLLVAACVGALLPLALRRLGIDPALAGSVVLTTITDVVGFLAFLGLATLAFRYLT